VEVLQALFATVLIAGFAAVFFYTMLDSENPLKLKINSYITGKPPAQCKKCGKDIPPNKSKCSSCRTEEGIKAIATLVTGAVGVMIAAHLLKAGFSFLKGINLEALNPAIKKAIEQASGDLESLRNNNERLNRAEGLLAAGDKISVDQAAMLTCATLEFGLKTLSQRHGVNGNLGEAEGMVDLATRLKDNSVITYADFQGIRNLVYRVRNPVMHGDFDRFLDSDVRDQIAFTRTFFDKHRLNNN
jgi:hypothetical protein